LVAERPSLPALAVPDEIEDSVAEMREACAGGDPSSADVTGGLLAARQENHVPNLRRTGARYIHCIAEMRSLEATDTAS
jgi:hypothetical protein